MARIFSDLREDARQKRILSVWNKGTKIEGHDAKVWRHDDFGNVIKFAEYSNRDSDYGWEIDHIVPVAAGGSDSLSNLRPLQWEANVRRN